jgi:copper transport protein
MSSPSRRGGVVLAAAATAGLAILILAGAGSLAPTAPAPRSASGVAPRPPPTTNSVADLVVSMSASPNQPGVNGFTVRAASSRRPPPAPVDGVLLDLGGAGDLVALEQTGSGEYVGAGRFNRSGTVRITAVVRRDGQRIAVPLSWSVGPAAPLPVAQPVATPPVGDSDRGFGSAVGALAMPLLGALAVGVRRLVRARVQRSGRRPESPRRPEAAERVLEGVP